MPQNPKSPTPTPPPPFPPPPPPNTNNPFTFTSPSTSAPSSGHEAKAKDDEKRLTSSLLRSLSLTNFGVTCLLLFLVAMLHGLWFSLTQIISNNSSSPLLRGQQKFNSKVIGVERHWYVATVTYADFHLIFFCFNVSLAALIATFVYGQWCWTQRMYSTYLANSRPSQIQAKIIHAVGAALAVLTTALLYIVRSQYSIVATLAEGYSEAETANLAFGWCGLYVELHLLYQFLVTSFLLRLENATKVKKYQAQPKLACTLLATVLHMICWVLNYWEYYHYGSLDWMAYVWCWLWYLCWNFQEFWKDSFPILYWRKDPYTGWPVVTLYNPDEEVDLNQVDPRTAAAANPFGFMHQFGSEPLFPFTPQQQSATTTTTGSSSSSGNTEVKKKR